MASEATPVPAVTLETADVSQMSDNERIKQASQGLLYVGDGEERHGFRDEVLGLERGERETLSGTAKELSKFFGIYKQQLRGERGKKTHEYIFMIRIKNPAGGKLSPRQWRALDSASDLFADGTLRITSRQSIQYHRVVGTKLGPLVRHLNRDYRSDGTLAACGDVNRNVMASPLLLLDPETRCGGYELAHAIADELAPRTTAYFEVFRSDADGTSQGAMNTTEPLYGPQYLPRKFKIGIAHPRDNSVDLRTHDIGYLPLDAEGKRWDVWTGGGLGLTHNNAKTAAHLGDYVGSVSREQAVAIARAILVIQKEHGERKDRKQARWKYTLRRLGMAAVRAQLRARFGIALEDAPPLPLPALDLHLGWHAQHGGGGYYGISVENGRLAGAQRAAVRAAIEQIGASVLLTPQQDLILCDLPDRAPVERILDAHGVKRAERVSRVRANAMACPAKPTCGLAMTDAENILPLYIDAIEAAGLGEVDVVIRMTGCPNNCARPPTAEIGIYGYGKNDHVLLVGGSRRGDRLGNPLYRRIAGEKMIPALVGLCRAIRDRAKPEQTAGDFLASIDPAELRALVGVDDPA